jgi:hypothetical protein
VEVVRDAIQALDEGAAQKMFSELQAAGGHLTTLSAVLR